MTDPSPSERSPNKPPLEEQVLAIFQASRKVIDSGNKKFPIFELENPHAEAVKKAVGDLAVDQLIELVENEPTEDVKAVASAWAEYQAARMVHDEAYSAYVESQNGALMDLLKGKRIKATARAGAERYAISPASGVHSSKSSSNPTEVSGTVLGANTSTSKLILAMDNPDRRYKYWVVDVLRGSPGDAEAQQLVDIQIEEPEPELQP